MNQGVADKHSANKENPEVDSPDQKSANRVDAAKTEEIESPDSVSLLK